MTSWETRQIRDLEEQVYNLTRKFNKMKQSRNKHRTENQELKDKIGNLDWSLLDAETEKKKALEERQNYYFKNEELKKKLRMSISKDEYYTNTKSMELGFEIIRQEFKKQLKKANEEIEGLKQKYHEAFIRVPYDQTVSLKEIEELKKENRRLLEREGELEWDVADASLKNKALQENIKLKKENQELFEELEYMKKEHKEF